LNEKELVREKRLRNAEESTENTVEERPKGLFEEERNIKEGMPRGMDAKICLFTCHLLNA
jgi:hypothetical protein